MYRCYLTTVVGGVTDTLEVTDDLMNWDDVTLSYKRDGLGAVMRSFSTEFEFAKDAYAALLAAFLADGVRAEASVRFQVRDAVAYTYSTLFECALDFSTFAHDGLRATVNAVDNTIAAKLKAARSQKFQYTASGLSGRTVTYRHLPMLNQVTWVVNERIDENDEKMYGRFGAVAGEPAWTLVPLAYSGAEIAVAGSAEYADVGWAYGKTGHIEDKLKGFFTAGGAMNAEVSLTFDTGVPDASGATITVFDLVLGKIETGEDGVHTLSVLSTSDVLNNRTVSVSGTYALSAGDQLCLYLLVTTDTGMLPENTSYEISAASLSVTYEAQDLRPVPIRAVTPSSLMQKLLDSICGSGAVTGSISSSDDRVQRTYLMAAESIRGISGAQIYSSWGDFCEAMDAEFGLVPVIDEDAATVTFMARPAVVFTSTVAHTFTADEAQDFQLRVAADMLASKVSIGYEKQEYDSVNGRDEWRWTAEYRTGIEVSDGEVGLISPYRADVYGIEFLTIARAEQTTDKEADEDIFLADVTSSGYMRTTEPVSGIIAVNAMPNARYTQREMAVANAFRLGMLTSSLDFTSIGGNRSAVVNGRAVTADISLVGYTHALPYEASFSTPLQNRFDWTQRLAVTHAGHTYTGWVKDVRFGVGRDTRVTYTLILNQIS